MTIWLISYTARGRALAARAAEILKGAGHDCRTFALPKFCGDGDEPLTQSGADRVRGSSPASANLGRAKVRHPWPSLFNISATRAARARPRAV